MYPGSLYLKSAFGPLSPRLSVCSRSSWGSRLAFSDPLTPACAIGLSWLLAQAGVLEAKALWYWVLFFCELLGWHFVPAGITTSYHPSSQLHHWQLTTTTTPHKHDATARGTIERNMGVVGVLVRLPVFSFILYSNPRLCRHHNKEVVPSFDSPRRVAPPTRLFQHDTPRGLARLVLTFWHDTTKGVGPSSLVPFEEMQQGGSPSLSLPFDTIQWGVGPSLAPFHPMQRGWLAGPSSSLSCDTTQQRIGPSSLATQHNEGGWPLLVLAFQHDTRRWDVGPDEKQGVERVGVPCMPTFIFPFISTDYLTRNPTRWSACCVSDCETNQN